MPILKNHELGPALEGVRALQKERLPTMTGVKLRRAARELTQAHRDVEEERVELLKLHARVDESGELDLDDKGMAKFNTAEDAEAFRTEATELFSGETSITEFLTPKDLIRKERDEDGRICDADDLPAIIIDLLGSLLREEDD